MRTRTNNVDTRVQGLFCTYIKNFLLAKEKSLLTQIYSIWRNRRPMRCLGIMRVGMKHTSSDNVRTDNVEFCQTRRNTYINVYYLP